LAYSYILHDGLSVGVHMMVMLAIPAVCLIYYARNYDFLGKVSYLIGNFNFNIVFKLIFPVSCLCLVSAKYSL
jgi:hypothetical protein